MTLARLKLATREVWQYDNKTRFPQWVANCVEWNDDDELYLVRRSGKQRIDKGDWLLRDLDGDPEWMTEADFFREYELT